MIQKIIFVMILGFIPSFSFSSQLLTLETQDLSYILKIEDDKQLYFSYFGEKINDPSPFLLKNTYRRPDYGTDPQAYLSAGGRNFRLSALRVTHADGDLNTELVYKTHSLKVLNENVMRLLIELEDKIQPFSVELEFIAYKKENVITQLIRLKNTGKETIVLHDFYSFYLPVKANKYYLNSFFGAWAKEMTLEETLLTHGIKTVESRKGVRTNHTENPSFLLSLDMPMMENTGNVIAGALAWNGNFRINFEADEFNILNITSGINPYASEYHLAPGEMFQTPEMVFTYSTSGAGEASRNLHDWARNYGIYDPKSIRPVLLNSWEGTYFDFDENTLKDMIDDAVDMGLEMFVLDDGWFGNEYPRNSDAAGLGDWDANKTKLPGGIASIADYAVNKGIAFGIWIEPEMVNPQSVLATQHPDWIVKSNGREATTMRNQWLLDLTNPEVRDFVFHVFDNTLKLSENITYVKWDANRHVESPGSTYLAKDKQSHFWIEYTKGLNDVYERIRKKHPTVIIQACSSGGGRVNYGALKYHQEVWTSDNTDGLSRAYIQYGTNLIYPALVAGSHVSASPNHQTNNATPLKFRFDMAMSGRLGMELQPKDMSPEEKTFAKNAIADYKKIRNIILFGDLYRIISPYDDSGFYAIMYVSKDKTQAVMFAYSLKYQGRTLIPQLKLNGLTPEKHYLLTELNTGESTFWGDNHVFSGNYLINEGINPPLRKMYDSTVFFITENDVSSY